MSNKSFYFSMINTAFSILTFDSFGLKAYAAQCVGLLCSHADTMCLHSKLSSKTVKNKVGLEKATVLRLPNKHGE